MQYLKYCFWLLMLGPLSPGQAADWSSLYSQAKLKAEKPRLQQAVDYLLTNEIGPFIPAGQKVSFGLQPIELPIATGERDPLSVYQQTGRVELPVLTLLFVEDLARAYGWLSAGRYTTKTIDEYLAMLRYRSPADFADGKYPAPLAALHVPDDALGDPKVVEVSLKTRRTAFAFLLLHEYAHVHLDLDAASKASKRELAEEQADAFALDIMKGNSTTPTGVLFVMQSWLFLDADKPEADHPITARRLEAMATYLDKHVEEFVRGRRDQRASIDVIHSIASLLRESAQYAEVPGHQAALRSLALKTDVASLKPRPLPTTTRY